MKKIFSAILTIASITMMSCTSSDNSVSYTTADHYFVKNDAANVTSAIFDNDSTFHSVFGMAAVMGEGGQPTSIDFNKQFVIGVVLPETDQPTEITPTKLVKEGDKLQLTYKVERGEKATSTMVPCLVLVVDNKDKGTLELKEE